MILDTEAWPEVLESSLRDALDQMAMLDLSVDPEAQVPPDPEKSVRVKMTLQCETPCHMDLLITRELAKVWSAAIAGVDEDEIEAGDAEDGASELLNMVAGAAKTTLGAQGIAFDVGIPSTSAYSPAASEDEFAGAHAKFRARVGDYPIEIYVSGD